MENVTPKRLGKSFIQRFLWSVLLLCAIAMADTAAPMELVYRTSAVNQTITLPLKGAVNVYIDWGDSQIEAKNASGYVTHIYSSIGDHTVKITGSLEQFGGGCAAVIGRDKLISVVSFGELGLKSLGVAFCEATNLTTVPSSLPSTVTDLSEMFVLASSFNQDISSWDVSNVTNMADMFRGATSFNQPIGDWDVSHVTDMSMMFSGAVSFHQDISDWNVANVTDMSYMFSGDSLFNQDISSWDVSNVTNMAYMFYGDSLFNQDIGDWNVGKVTDMHGMFREARSFNQDISNWNVANVNSMSFMFLEATSFNQPIGKWDVSKVLTMDALFSRAISFNQDISAWDVKNVKWMYYMFYNATSFNQPIGNWNVANVTDMSGMFYGAISFNQPTGNWNVANVANMSFMFSNARSFNQPIGNWNVSKVTKMNDMLRGTSAFNQDVSNWNVAKVTNMANMLDNTGLSVKNYDALLLGWSKQALQSKVPLSARGAKYTQSAARDLLIKDFGWYIYGDSAATPQTIAFADMAKSYGDASFIPTATASSGFAITYASSNDAVATVENGQIAIKGAGTATITASQDGDKVIGPVSATASLVVAALPLTITVDAKSKTAGEADPALTYTITNGALLTGDAITGSLTRENGETANTYAILQGTLSAGANYDITYVGANLTIADKANQILDFAGSSAFRMYASLHGKRLQVQMQNSQGPVQISVYDIHGNVIAQASSYNSALEYPVDAGAGQRLYVVAKDAKGRTLSSQRMLME